MSARDTTPDAAAVRAAVYRRMSDEQRANIGVQMSEDAREIAHEAIRQRHPEYDDRQATLALFRLLLGDDLFRRVWPTAPLLQP
ncbi:MAG TPA: hypothetical protein VIV40_05840 [Kofleriaceae bacterium]